MKEASTRSTLQTPARHLGSIMEDILEKASWRRHLPQASWSTLEALPHDHSNFDDKAIQKNTALWFVSSCEAR